MATQTVLAQLLSLIPKRDFRRCVERHRGDHNVRTFSCWDQFVCMVVAQLGRKESLRELETCIRGMKRFLYHAGIRGVMSRNTLAYANERRLSTIYADFCHILIRKTRKLYADEVFMRDLDGLVYVLDSTIITLSLSLCPWAYFGMRPPAGMKVHAQLDLKGPIPSFIHISKVKISDNLFLDLITIEAGAFYIMDRAYFDLARLYNINLRHGYFIVRPKQHVKFIRLKSNFVPKGTGVSSDWIVRCSGQIGSKKYPGRLRRIRYRDLETRKLLIFLTNNFDLPAATIAKLYKARWEIEIFFKWIKQNLRLDSFLGRTMNAIETQIWIAVAAYLTVAIAKKQLNIPASLTEIISFLPQALFMKIPIHKAFTAYSSENTRENQSHPANQLELF